MIFYLSSRAALILLICSWISSIYCSVSSIIWSQSWIWSCRWLMNSCCSASSKLFARWCLLSDINFCCFSLTCLNYSKRSWIYFKSFCVCWLWLVISVMNKESFEVHWLWQCWIWHRNYSLFLCWSLNFLVSSSISLS